MYDTQNASALSDGITEGLRARTLQAVLASAAAFSVGAVLPLLTTFLVPRGAVAVGAATVLVLLLRGALHVAGWGVLAMAATAVVAKLVGVTGETRN